MQEYLFEGLKVIVCPDRQVMGRQAGEKAADVIRAAIERNGHARVILASAPSQNETLDALTASRVEWGKVTIFHMDEYLGLAAAHPQTFRTYQREHVLARVKPAEFHGIEGETTDAGMECIRYGKLLNAAPIDLCCFGIGENGHLAFNDPPVAAFDDSASVKVVELDPECRQQQVNDGCFGEIALVPRKALTLTIPALMRAEAMIGSVPGPRKARAVLATVREPVATACPATILRRHPNAIIYVDEAAWAEARASI